MRTEMLPRNGETLDAFVERWNEAHKELLSTELGQNGQFDEIPYGIYEDWIS